MALNPLAHISITGVIHTFKAKHKMASLYTLSYITWQLEETPGSNCSFITAALPNPQTSHLQLEKLAPKCEATCPRPHSAVGQT